MTERISGLKGSWAWLQFAAQLPSNPQPLKNITAGSLVYSGRCILTGAIFNNTATAAGAVQLLDGVDATGALIAGAQLPASTLTPLSTVGQGILCEIGVFLVPTGTIAAATVLVIPLWHDEFTSPGT